MRKEIIAAAALLLAFNVSAQEVVLHKCLDGSGVPIYQSKPCARGQQSAGVVRDYIHRSPAKDQAIERRRQSRSAGADYLSRLAGTDRPRRGQPLGAAIPAKPQYGQSACDRARRQRKQYMDVNHGNYEIRDALDDAVMEACY